MRNVGVVPGEAVRVMFAELLFRVAVMRLVWVEVTVAAVAVKAPVVDPAFTFTEEGTVKAPVLLESPTEGVTDGALLKLTVQPTELPEETDVEEQVTEETVIVTTAAPVPVREKE